MEVARDATKAVGLNCYEHFSHRTKGRSGVAGLWRLVANFFVIVKTSYLAS